MGLKLSKQKAERSLKIASDNAKLGRKPLGMFPGEPMIVELKDLPEAHFTVHPGFVIVNNIYLDKDSADGECTLNDVRHLLHVGRFYAITDRQRSYIRITE